MRRILLICMLALLAAPAAALASTQRVAASSVERGSATFRLNGLAPASIQSARLSAAGRGSRRLAVSTVRRAAQRGVLRVRTGRVRSAALVLSLRGGRTATRPSEPAKAPTSAPAPANAPAPAAAPTQSNAPVTQPGALMPPVEVPAGARFVSPSGSDANAGTESAPWRTLGKALSSARPGDTVVLRAGSYGALGTTTQVSLSGTAERPITFMGHPDEARPAIQGYVRITGSHLRLAGLLFDGPTGRVLQPNPSNPGGEEVQVSVMYGSDVEIRGSEIRDNAWHAGLFVHGATDVRLLGNHIHDNGDRAQPSQANLDHGIYWSSGSGTVANNVIENNLAYGVHLYPNSTGVTVAHNTIVGNDKGGVIVAEAAAGNRIANNVIAGNALSGIKAYALTGTGNRAEGNLLWANGPRNFDGAGIALSANLEANPQFAGAADYRLRSDSPAIDRGLAGYGVNVDFALRQRAGTPDLGAYEAR